MIQEKDFLYRVPVKTAPITTPGGQIRNPEILIDIEGGEFMHGNILDANSTNKLINQSVDDKITEGGYVTKNLLDAETARATAKENEIKAQVDIINGDSTTEGSFRKAIADVVAAAPEDLDTLKEIADKLAGNDDLHTALNQAITEKADASALLNEVARATGVENNLKATLVNYALNSDVEEKLAQKADTTMLSEFIDKTSTEEQAINSPLHAKEYISVFHNTADGSSGIKITNSGILAIDQLNENASPNKVFATDGSIADLSQYADATQLSNYVLTTALNQQVDILNTAIDAKQPKGNYLTEHQDLSGYAKMTNGVTEILNDTFNEESSEVNINKDSIVINNGKSALAVGDMIAMWGNEGENLILKGDSMYFGSAINEPDKYAVQIRSNGGHGEISLANVGSYSDVAIDKDGLTCYERRSGRELCRFNSNGITSYEHNNCLATSDGTFKPISDFALKTELPTVPTNIVTASAISDRYFGFEKAIEIYSEAINKIMTIGYTGINFQTNKNDVAINEDGFFISSDSDDTDLCSFTTSGIKFAGKTSTDIPTANGGFISLSDLANKENISSLSAGLQAKQNKITVNSVDVTDIETADAEKLRTIVTNLTNALSESGLIRLVENVE